MIIEMDSPIEWLTSPVSLVVLIFTKAGVTVHDVTFVCFFLLSVVCFKCIVVSPSLTRLSLYMESGKNPSHKDSSTYDNFVSFGDSCITFVLKV